MKGAAGEGQAPGRMPFTTIPGAPELRLQLAEDVGRGGSRLLLVVPDLHRRLGEIDAVRREGLRIMV